MLKWGVKLAHSRLGICKDHIPSQTLISKILDTKADSEAEQDEFASQNQDILHLFP